MLRREVANKDEDDIELFTFSAMVDTGYALTQAMAKEGALNTIMAKANATPATATPAKPSASAGAARAAAYAGAMPRHWFR